MRCSTYASLSLAALIVGAAIGFLVMPIQAAPAQAQAVLTPRNLREQFAIDLLAALGNTQPTVATVAFVVEWTLAEDGSDGALARNNPLNTTQSSGAANAVINGDGVKGYATYQDGLDATVTTLTNGLYNPLVSALQTNDAAGALQALIASPWAASHYGGGVGWPHVELDIPTQPAPVTNDAARQQVIAAALSQVGKSYLLGSAGPNTFDCSGLVQWSYAQVGVETTRTTFTQLKELPPVDPTQLQPADMVYFQYPSDQHTGILADLDGDGRWDMIQSGGTRSDVNVVYDVFSDPVYANAIIGYRRAL